MPVISVRVSEEVYSRYRSMDPEKREKIYRTLQAVVSSVIEGRIDPAVPMKIDVHLCRDRGAKFKEAQKAYIYVVEALTTLRRAADSNPRKLIADLRRFLIPLSLNTPDRESLKYIRRIHEAYQDIINTYIEGRNIEEKHINSLASSLLEMKRYLEERYAVF